MKLLTFEHDNNETVGILAGSNKIYPLNKSDISYKSMHELISNITDEEIKLLTY